jgi:hypothetical protein
MTLVEKLEQLGFLNFFTMRIGPCFQCDPEGEKKLQTFYNPDLKRWYCEDCWYDTDFISELMLMNSRKSMSTIEERLRQMEANYANLQAENAKLKASREDNCFVGGTDNLTLKHRAINPKAWGVPTKAQNGQGYFRCSDFPMNFDVFVDPSGANFIRVFTAIPVDPRQAKLFRERYVDQGIVQAKRRIPKEEAATAQATAQAFGTPTQPSAPVATIAATPQATGPRSFSTLPEAERLALSQEADKLMAVPGLFKDKLSALQSILVPKNIVLP